MCGLAALFHFGPNKPPVAAATLDRIRDAMLARGPDGAGSWIAPDGRVGLGHRRLAIIDLSDNAAQPMSTADGRLRIVFNGEIYNHAILRAGLEADGAVFHSRSDTEVLLHLYRRDGVAGLDRLRGMFAFALWDEDKRGLLLARDHFGIKPLYVSERDGVLSAASQVKALLAGGGCDTRPHPAGHAGFFLWGHVPEPFTLHQGIRALPAGSWLWQDLAGGRREGRFFDIRAEMAQAGEAASEPEARDRLRSALLDSVRAHLIADVPVGLFLSGGLDSATLAALATEIHEPGPRAVTLGFPDLAGTPGDEVPLARSLAAKYGLEHYVRGVSAADFAASRAELLEAMDQPTVDGTNVWLVAREARRLGLKVALSGLGGDELFGGYNTFATVPSMARAMRPWSRVPGLGQMLRRFTGPLARRLGSPKSAGLIEWGGSLGGAYLLRRGLFMPWELPGVMGAEAARDGLAELNLPDSLNASCRDLSEPTLAVSALEMQCYMRNQLLRDADWAGMAHSLEIRVPLVDIGLFRAVLPFLLGPMPRGKRPMAECTRPLLPGAVLDRPKTGFHVPIAQWLGERSLRGWATRVHRHFVDGCDSL